MRRFSGALLLSAVMCCACWLSPAYAISTFTVKDIEIDGLKRISLGTVLNYLPIEVGSDFNEDHSADIIRALYKTGFFKDVRLARRDDTLVITVVERPAIAAITFSGNKDISSDQLLDALKTIGLAKGEVFNQSSLEQVERELRRQYYSQGKYSVAIKSTVKNVDADRVDIAITIDEGDVAKIRAINIVGNKLFPDKVLLDEFQLTSKRLFSFFTKSDQYSKQKLTADLETLRSYYLDRGYINFAIESTQVSISPNKRDVFITIAVNEGEKYTVSDIKIDGDPVVPVDELEALITLHSGDTFSRKEATASAASIGNRLGDEGYAFANVNTIPNIDQKAKQVALTFFIAPGKRVYVHRVEIAGNIKTEDNVLRREMRQLEGGWVSTDKVSRSRVRLQRLGYFEEANVETPAVPGVDDQVDVKFSVKERPSGSLMAGVGFSQEQGLLLNASISQNNFLGSGKRVSATINNSNVNTNYSFAYTNPYYTVNGVSRGFNVYLRNTDAGNANVADYTADMYGGNVSFGYPNNEFSFLNFSLGVEHTRLKETLTTPSTYSDFIKANSNEFDILKASASWTYDTRDKTIFADTGWSFRLASDVALPGSGLTYYKLTSRAEWYHPLSNFFTLRLKGDVGVGDSYGETTMLPFFENFYAGGSRSVRGFRGNTLGPRQGSNPLGGALKTVGSMGLIVPVPFVESAKSVRLSLFVDGGTVYASADKFDAGELRYSTGASLIWLSPMGPLAFSLAYPLNSQNSDEIEHFQFTLGTAF